MKHPFYIWGGGHQRRSFNTGEREREDRKKRDDKLKKEEGCNAEQKRKIRMCNNKR